MAWSEAVHYVMEAHRSLVKDFSSSMQAPWKYSRLVMICAIWENVEVPARRWATGSLM